MKEERGAEHSGPSPPHRDAIDQRPIVETDPNVNVSRAECRRCPELGMKVGELAFVSVIGCIENPCRWNGCRAPPVGL